MKKLRFIYNVLSCCWLAFVSSSCKDNDSMTILSLEKNGNTIMVYLKDNPDSYSVLTEALQMTHIDQNLQIYGDMTLFAPSNAAFQKYFERKGISGLSEMNVDSLAEILRYHIYNEKYTSNYFVSGTLPTPTISGNFIKLDLSEGLRNAVLNDKVKITTLDVLAANGVIHELDDVLEPASYTLYDWLQTQPGYSVMLKAFEETGNADLILKKVEYDPDNLIYGRPGMKWSTIFLETNDVLAQAGINSFEDLAQRFSDTYHTTKSYTTDSLNLFVRYHCLATKYFLSDFSDTYLESFSDNDYLIFSTAGGNLTINKRTEDFLVTNPDGSSSTVQKEVKVILDNDQSKSNIITKNGIVNSLGSVLSLYKVKPIPVTQLFAGAPSERGIKLIDGTSASFPDAAKNLTTPEQQVAVPWLKWGLTTGFTVTTAGYTRYWNGDNVFAVAGGLTGYWIELTTKLVFRGTYDVFVSYTGLRRGTAGQNAIFYMDGQQIGDITNLASDLDAFGNKCVPPGYPGSDLNDPWFGFGDNRYRRKLGTLTFDEAMPHVLRLEGLANSSGSWYSMELVPVNN